MSWRILYVDDEADLRELMEIALGFDPELELTTCASGAAAMEALREGQFDLLLLDMMMPEMDGPATLASVIEQGLVPLVVLFLTARVGEADVARLKALGAADVLAKPFDPIALPDILKDRLRER